MTSIGNFKRQVSNDSAYFIGIAPLVDKVFTSPAGGSTPSIVAWASTGGGASGDSVYTSTVSSAGAILKDMGRTVTSSGVFFRKVQLVVPQGAAAAARSAKTTSTFGVAGAAPNGGVTPDYLTGYIVLGFDGQGVPAPVAKFGL